MNSAIIFIKSAKELEIAKARLLGKPVIEYTVKQLKRINIDYIYLIGGGEINIDGVIKRNNIRDLIGDISTRDGNCLIVSPFYPLLSSLDYQFLLDNTVNGMAIVDSDGISCAFMLPNYRLNRFENIDFKSLVLKKINSKRIKSLSDLPDLTEEIKLKINTRLLSKGVNIIDPYSTYISEDVTIDSGTTVYSNVVIEGNSIIGKNNVITNGSFLSNVVIGNDNKIECSKVSDSKIGNFCNIGPYAHIRNNSIISDEVRIGNYVEIKNSNIGRLTRILHLSYIGDTNIAEDVNIGCGVVTINYDGVHKFETNIKSHAFIGSNSNIIAPVTIGEYSVVAAGSTVDNDVPDGDMAISRLYQTNKKGYGYRYLKKEK